MIDPKLLSTYSDAEVANLKARIANLDPRHLDILDRFAKDDLRRVDYVLADSESRRVALVRDAYRERVDEFAHNLKGISLLPVAVLGGMAAYPGEPVTGAEVAALCSVSAALAGTAFGLDSKKDDIAKKISTFIRHKAAKNTPMVGEIEALPVKPENAVVPTPGKVALLADLARGMKERSPLERGLCHALGYVISRHNGALAAGKEIDRDAQMSHLQELRLILDEMTDTNLAAASRHERTVSATLNAYGMRLPSSQKYEAAPPQQNRGLAFGA